MSDIGPIHGLAFLVVAIATASLGVIALVVQSVVVAALRFTRKGTIFSAWDDVALAIAGPVACVTLGGVPMLVIDHLDMEQRELLDTLAPGLLLAGIAVWTTIQLLLVLARRRRRAT